MSRKELVEPQVAIRRAVNRTIASAAYRVSSAELKPGSKEGDKVVAARFQRAGDSGHVGNVPPHSLSPGFGCD